MEEKVDGGGGGSLKLANTECDAGMVGDAVEEWEIVRVHVVDERWRSLYFSATM